MTRKSAVQDNLQAWPGSAITKHPVTAFVAGVLLWLLATGSALAQNYKVEASLEPQQAIPGETVVYILTVTHDGRQSPPRPPAPQFDPSWSFTPVPGDFSTTQFSIVNGVATQSVEYRYPFTVSKEGQYSIPAVSFSLNGRQYSSNPVTLTVAKAPVSGNMPTELQGKIAQPIAQGNPQLTRQLAGGVFVLPVLDNETIYEGQQVKLAYHLVIDREVLRKAGLTESFGIQAREAPELKQFLQEILYDLPRNLQFQERVIGGKKYVVAPLYEAAITPVKTGKLEIESYKLQLSMRSQQRRGGGGGNRDPFFNDSFFSDPFFDSHFGSGVSVLAQAPPLALEVKPVPAQGRPADFSGAVGDFTLSSQLNKRAAVADEDIVEMSLQIEGQGDAGAISPPPFPSVDGLVLLEQPTFASGVRKEGSNAVSTKTFTYKLRPTKSGTLRIPPLSVTTFDPTSSQYEILKTEPQEVQAVASSQKPLVTEATATAGAPPALAATPTASDGDQAATPGPREIADDMRYINTGSFTVVRPGILTGESPALYLALAAPPMFLLAGWLAGRRHNDRQTNRARYRAGRAGASARRHLRRVAALLKHDDPVPFYNELARALRGFFGDRFHMESAGLTIEQIEEELERRGASEEAVLRTRHLLDEADQARYAPVRIARDVQQRTYDDATKLLNDLEKLP